MYSKTRANELSPPYGIAKSCGRLIRLFRLMRANRSVLSSHDAAHSSCERTCQGASRPNRNTRSISDYVCTHARTPRSSRSDRYRFALINFSYCRSRTWSSSQIWARTRAEKKTQRWNLRRERSFPGILGTWNLGFSFTYWLKF